MDLKSECHVFVHHTVLMNDLDLLGWICLNLFSIVNDLHESVCGRYTIAVLRVWEENSHVLGKALKGIRLNQMYIWIVRLHHTSRYFTLFTSEHQVGYISRIILLKFLLIFFFIVFWFLLLVYPLLLFY